ncbi:amidase family protein [Streptomyces sp. NBC_01264]|uniref:amidase family protein n=1 Tax=Streptomyces sp. NBC_01264 TaxID=2903804 RepID=UPI002251339F|nr:amidase family protein [Streptomyces sp. NBC_01264]MCX4781671.1 amidase family protein [Streptomyces sp. NBC_01264]
MADDPQTRGDLWRAQLWVPLPSSSQVRPASYPALAPVDAEAASDSLSGKRVGVPRMYINADADAGTNPDGGIGGQTGQRVDTRPSVITLWAAARRDLEAAGDEVVEVDFPVVTNYESDRPDAPSLFTREYLAFEIEDLSAWAWDDFLRGNGDPALPSLAEVDATRIWPKQDGELPDRYEGFDDTIGDYPRFVRERPYASLADMPHLEQGLRGLEETRRADLEAWMDGLGLDAVVFPAVADVGPADMDVSVSSADLGWRNGVWVANGNLVPRHLGIPTVTVPMGAMSDTGMPVGLTFAGRAYDDNAVLVLATAFEKTGSRRTEPVRTPRLSAQ